MDRLTTGRVILILLFGTGLNVAAGRLAGALQFPIYLNSLGTVMVAGMVGVWAAVGVAVVAHVIETWQTGNATLMWYLPVPIAVGLYAGLAIRGLWFRRASWAVPAGAALGIITATLSILIASLLLRGEVPGRDLAGLRDVTTDLGAPVFLGIVVAVLATEVLDKSAVFFLARFVLRRIPGRVMRATRFEKPKIDEEPAVGGGTTEA